VTSDRYSPEVQGAIDHLQAGGRLFLIEEKPYPAPHQAVIIHGDERYSISYNDFAFLLTRNIIHLIGSTTIDGFPAEEFIFTQS
jgi:hypothetical protein